MTAPDLAAIEAAHDAKWQTLNHPPRHLTNAELSAQRTANDDALSALMRPVLEADATRRELLRLGYVPTREYGHPYRTASGAWMQTGRGTYERDGVTLSLIPPGRVTPTLAESLALPWTLSGLAQGPAVSGGPGQRARLRDLTAQIAQHLHRDGLHDRVETILLTTTRRQHPNTNHEGVNYCSSGLSVVQHFFTLPTSGAPTW